MILSKGANLKRVYYLSIIMIYLITFYFYKYLNYLIFLFNYLSLSKKYIYNIFLNNKIISKK